MGVYVLGVDQSYAKSGLVVLKDTDMVHFEIFSSNKEDDIFKRALDVSTHILNIAQKYNVKWVAIEGLAFKSFGNVTRDLAGLQFAIKIKLEYEHNIPTQIISPTNVKKIATGKGNAKKQVLYQYLPEKIQNQFYQSGARKSTTLYDLTDAYWIAQTSLKTPI